MDESKPACSKAGYLYAVNAGFWPNPDGVFQLRVKLGSFRTVDPVASMIHAYQRVLGHPQLIWAEPSADAYTDETSDLFVALASHRVWERREIFVFADLEDCLEILDNFSHNFRRRTAGATKPPMITDLINPWMPQQRLEEDRTARKRARLEQLEEQRAEEDATMARKDGALRTFIEENCAMGLQERVEARIFNQAVKSIVAYGVKSAMHRLGFEHKKVSIDGKKVWVYPALSLA